MKRVIPITAALFLVAVLAYVPRASAENPHFTTIDYPGAGVTVANGVNQNGEIVGSYRMALPTGGLGPTRGFLLSNGQPSTIYVPNSAATLCYGINNAGDIVGVYIAAGVNYGFRLKAGSANFETIRYTETDPTTGTTTFAARFTDSWGIDEEGNVTGGFNDANGHRRAYVWRDGSFDKIMEVPDTTFTYTHGLNANGEIVGCYFKADPMDPENIVMHSLRVTSDGDFLTEDFPGSMMSMHWRITDSSIIVGHYFDMDGNEHGYLYKDGDYESIDFPDSTLTEAHGIAEIELSNHNGDPLGSRQLLIVGPYVDSNNVRHGFLYTRRVGVGLNGAQ